jgi:hypothetical protein
VSGAIANERWYNRKSRVFKEVDAMVIITFPNKRIQTEALAFLLGRFSGTVLKTGEYIVPEQALQALAKQNFVFTVRGNVDDKEVATLRSIATASLQRRKPRAISYRIEIE